MFLRKFLILIFFVLLNSVKAETLKQIDLLGLESISRGTVLSYLPVEVGDEYSDAIKKRTIESLSKTNFFSSISVDYERQILVISFKENPTIKYFDFIDFKEDDVLSEKIIDEIKSNYELINGRIFVKSNFDKLLNDLNNLYSSNGFYNAKITIKTDLDEKNRIGLELIFDEGEKALIKSMKVQGNKFFSSDEILDLFDMGEPDFFIVNYFTEKDSFSKTKFESGIESIKSKYLSEGFLDITVDSSNISYSKIDNNISIVLTINEGMQYKVDQINLTGNNLNISNHRIRSFIQVEDGDIFRQKDIVEGVGEIKNFFEDNGYAFASVVSSASLLDNTQNVVVNISIDPDLKVYIDRIEISGNHTTQDDVIRRQLLLNEGSLYSKKELDESIKKIKRLGYFTDVNYEIKRHSNNLDKSDLFIRVTETKTGEITVGLSQSNATGASVTAGIRQNNILGTGNTLNAQISNSDAVKEYSFYFKDPYINNFGHSLSYGYFNKSLDAGSIDASDYILDENGFNFGYGIPTSDSSDIFSELRISNISVTCGADLKDTYEISQCNNNKKVTEAMLSIVYDSNTLNDFFFPTDGNRDIHSFEFTLPGVDNKYLRFSSVHKNYSQIFEDKTLKFSSRIKLATGYGGSDLPFYKRYFEGGSSSIRGFDFNSLGPKYQPLNKPKGGELSFISSLGVASNLKFVGIDNPNMRIIGFVDAGTISEKISNFTLSDFRASAGIQLSWLTPIGPIGLHIAQPFVKKSGDATETLSFDLGATF